jgi:hypothetical protein
MSAPTSQPATDERQPLLPPPPPTTQPGPPRSANEEGVEPTRSDGLDPADPLVQNGELPVQPVKKKATAWSVAFRVLIVILLGLGIYVLVKAIVDADHVDVRISSS